MASHNDTHRVFRASRHHLEVTFDRVETFLTPEARNVVQVYRTLLPQLWSVVEGRPLPALSAKILAEAARAAKIAANKGAPERAFAYATRAFDVLAHGEAIPDDVAKALGKLPDYTIVNLTALPGKPGHIPGHKPRPPRPKQPPVIIVAKPGEK